MTGYYPGQAIRRTSLVQFRSEILMSFFVVRTSFALITTFFLNADVRFWHKADMTLPATQKLTFGLGDCCDAK